jgi:uncharacterized protein HemY
LAQTGDPESAARLLEAMADEPECPNRFNLLIQLAQMHISLGREEKALSILMDLHPEGSAEKGALWSAEAEAEYRLGHRQKAMSLDRKLSVEENLPPEIRGGAALRLAQIAFDEGRRDAATVEMERAFALGAESTATAALVVRIGDSLPYIEARAFLLNWLVRLGRNPSGKYLILLELGRLGQTAKQWPDARFYYRQARELTADPAQQNWLDESLSQIERETNNFPHGSE